MILLCALAVAAVAYYAAPTIVMVSYYLSQHPWL